MILIIYRQPAEIEAVQLSCEKWSWPKPCSPPGPVLAAKSGLQFWRPKLVHPRPRLAAYTVPKVVLKVNLFWLPKPICLDQFRQSKLVCMANVGSQTAWSTQDHIWQPKMVLLCQKWSWAWTSFGW